MTVRLRPYNGHKIVHARKIASITFFDDMERAEGQPMNKGMCELLFDGGETLIKSKKYTERTKLREKQQAGDLGYYVSYDSGAYASWSPAEQFEKGYSLCNPEDHHEPCDHESSKIDEPTD